MRVDEMFVLDENLTIYEQLALEDIENGEIMLILPYCSTNLA